MKNKNSCIRGFTLIELLVVVLIIGILAAIALPQYQKAVEKARLAKLMPMVQLIYQAEEVYHLSSGKYTADLPDLDVEASNCEFETKFHKTQGYYNCGDYRIGVYDGPINAQVQLRKSSTENLAYLHYFADDVDLGISKGEKACFADGQIYNQVCRSLGKIERELDVPSWEYGYVISR